MKRTQTIEKSLETINHNTTSMAESLGEVSVNIKEMKDVFKNDLRRAFWALATIVLALMSALFGIKVGLI